MTEIPELPRQSLTFNSPTSRFFIRSKQKYCSVFLFGVHTGKFLPSLQELFGPWSLRCSPQGCHAELMPSTGLRHCCAQRAELTVGLILLAVYFCCFVLLLQMMHGFNVFLSHLAFNRASPELFLLSVPHLFHCSHQIPLRHTCPG